MAGTFDPHTQYLPQKAKESFQTQMGGEYAGLGVGVGYDLDFERVIITGTFDGGPAARSGIEKFDAIEGIRVLGKNDELVDATEMDATEFSDTVKGKKGQEICLVVKNYEKNTAEREVCFEREIIQAAKQSTKLDTYKSGDKTLGVLRILSFYHNPQKQRGVSNDVRELLQKQKLDGLVVDLRYNGGGALIEAEALAGLFLNGGSVLKMEGNGQVQNYEDPDPAEFYDMPLVVLINSYSASASEIFAAAIQDYDRGIVVGGKSFGKGTVQRIYNVVGGSGFKVTVAGFYRVTGQSTQFNGVVPDIKISQYVDTDEGERKLDNALELPAAAPMTYRSLAMVDDRKLEQMRANSQRRIASNINFSKIDQAKERDRKINEEPISLNLEKRKALQKQIEDFNNTYEDQGDAVLNEAKSILEDYL